MAEEKKKEFEKTKEMTNDEVDSILDTNFGPQIKLQDVKVNHHLIMKILKPVEAREYELDGDKKTTHKFWCSYKPKGCDPFELSVQVGEGAVKRLQEKYPDESYVDLYAFFTRTKFEGKYPQFVNPMAKGKYSLPVDKSDLFKPKENKAGEKAKPNSAGLDLTDFDNFTKRYKEALEKDPDVKASPVHMMGSFIHSSEKEKVKELLVKCKEALK